MARAHESRIQYSDIGRRVRARREIQINALERPVQPGEVGTVVDAADLWLFVDFDSREAVIERGAVVFVV